MPIERSMTRYRESGVDLYLPRIVVQGASPGPSVLVTANVHGDETVGTGAALALAERLDVATLRGCVTLVPSCNPVGLAHGVRTFGEDGPDLNRLFPGDDQGTPASRYTAWLWSELCAIEPDLVVDLHADSVDAIAYAIVDRPIGHRGAERRAMEDALTGLAGASGLTVLYDYADADYLRFGLDRSLAGAMVNVASVPAVTIECGPRGALSRAAEARMVHAVLGMLAWAGCGVRVPDAVVSAPVPGPWRRTSGPRVRKSGLLRPRIGSGVVFGKGDHIADVVDTAGQVLDRVVAMHAGLLVAWANQAWIRSGQAVATVATLETR